MPWRGPKQPGEVPTLGWTVLDFIEDRVVIPDGEFAGEPFLLSDIQRDFILGFYRLKPDAVPDRQKPSRSFVYERGGQLVAPQKWGKGPFSAAMIIAEAYGPVLFDGWDANGEPVGRSWATPWIQVAAISEDQTANIWRALIPMIELGDLKAEIPDTGETRINLPGRGRIEPVTSSARSRLGQRITFACQDEAHDWNVRNGGRKLADVQRRNLSGMGGRFLETGNAWDPAEDSVAEFTFEKETLLMKIRLHGGPGSIKNKRERMRVLNRLYEGSWWIDVERISAEIDNLIERGEVAQAERYFMNRIVPGEDRAFDPKQWRELAKTGTTIPKAKTIVIGVDGARFRDALAMVATDVETGFQWPLGIWVRPENAEDDYEHPMDEVDGALIGAFEEWDVWRVYIDPGSQYANIAPLMERWQGRYGEKRIIEWLMTRLRPTAFMIRGYASAIATGDVTHDGDAVFEEHIKNARRKMVNVYDEDGHAMFVLQKDSPNSRNKIDAASAGALSWQARGDAIAAGAMESGGYDDPAQKCARPGCGHLRRHHVPACRGRPLGHCNQFEEPIL